VPTAVVCLATSLADTDTMNFLGLGWLLNPVDDSEESDRIDEIDDPIELEQFVAEHSKRMAKRTERLKRFSKKIQHLTRIEKLKTELLQKQIDYPEANWRWQLEYARKLHDLEMKHRYGNDDDDGDDDNQDGYGQDDDDDGDDADDEESEMMTSQSSQATSTESTRAVWGGHKGKDEKHLDKVKYPHLKRWVREAASQVVAVRNQKEPEVMEEEDDQQVIKVAMKSQQQQNCSAATATSSNGATAAMNKEAANWIGRLSYQWFCMDEKLRVLHDLFPDRRIVPNHLDIMREVNQRWKNLTPERKQRYVDIATYQYEKKFGPVSHQDNQDFKS